MHQQIHSNIKALPDFVVNQIKAGEVVERPSQLIKELIENSLDAKPSVLKITIKNNGLDTIKIEDDGHGMSKADMDIAFQRHTTSKIQKFDDIYQLSSFGFRGEALASIAAVSLLTCQSKTINDHHWNEMILDGGRKQSESTFNLPGKNQGTVMIVEDLFSQTPVRLKFLKSNHSEKSAIEKIINGFLVSSPEIRFEIQIDDKETEVIPSHQGDELSRIAWVFNRKKNIKSEISCFSIQYDNVQVSGYFTHFSVKGVSKKQFLYVNERIFQESSLHHFFIRSLEPLWEGLSGHYCLKIHCPASEVDVNVHPSKTQVKFLDLSLIMSLMKKGIQSELEKFGPHQLNEQESLQHSPLGLTQNQSRKPRQSAYHNFSDQSKKKQSYQHDPNIIQNTPLALLTNEIALLNKDEEIFLVSIVKLVKNYLTSKAWSSAQVIPLIIAEPLKITSCKNLSSQHLQKIEEAGFQLSFTDEEESILLLRSLPEGFGPTQFGQLLDEVINLYREVSPVKCFESFFTESLDKISDSAFTLNIHQLNKILTFYDRSELLTKKIFISVNQTLFEK